MAERTLQRELHSNELERHTLKQARHVPDYKSGHEFTGNAFYCSDPERAFLDAIKKSYLKFSKEYWESNKIHKYNDDVVELYLTFSDEILEGDDLLIDELEHVIRAWEEELS